jgi:hypothetical protein
MMSQRPVHRRSRRSRVTGWAMTLVGLVLAVGALLARTSLLPAAVRVLLLAAGVVGFSIGLIIITAGAR